MLIISHEVAAQSYAAEESWQESYIKMLSLSEAGNAEAQFTLGAMYYSGIGVERDEASAILWWTKSADQGNEFAKEWLNKLTTKNGE